MFGKDLKITLLGLKIAFTGLQKQYNQLRLEILDTTDRVLRSGQLMSGNYTAEFEAWLARRNGVKYAVTCHSGTHALEIIAEYYATQIEQLHPRVLIPTMTFAATANAFMRAGWDIHFIDTDAYGCIDPNKIPVKEETYEAVVLIGLYGAGVRKYRELRHWQTWLLNSTFIIEDAAQHWLADGGLRIGDAAAVSFDPMKNLANYGNGGAVLTDDLHLADYARAWTMHGKPNNDMAGSNSRMSEIDCATLLVKSRYIDQWQVRRQEIATYWRECFRNSGIRCLIDQSNDHGHAYHKFVIDIDNRKKIQKSLGIRGIETRIHYEHPLHETGVFRQWPAPDMFAASSSLARRVLSLPLYPELTDLEVEYIKDQVLDCVESEHN
jgi:dTDP-4-amino-4,6-dideoxygalactose transaminase